MPISGLKSAKVYYDSMFNIVLYCLIMPRNLRIEYPGAVYHILNRGNYREDIFSMETIKEVCEATLFAACERSSWVLHAHTILENHFHLALETPQANLSVGMRWLQATFSNRFNRIVRTQGHVFQGRYKSLVVDRDEYMGTLLDYIHLNPVRAGIVSGEGLRDYRWSSLWYLFRKRKRPPCLDLSSCLYYAGRLVDTPPGRKKYLSYLDWLATKNQAESTDKFKHLCRGWALGTKEFKKGIMDEEQVQWIESVGKETEEARFLYWEQLLGRLLTSAEKTEADLLNDRKSATWKVMIAYHMKKTTLVTNSWFSAHLRRGRPQGVSRYVRAFEKAKGFKTREYRRVTAKINTPLVCFSSLVVYAAL
ncbi:transposase [Planctomycetota bacterium]